MALRDDLQTNRYRIPVEYNVELDTRLVWGADGVIINDDLRLLADSIVSTPVGVQVGVFNEVPGGAIDGLNTVFTTAYSFVSGTTDLYFNGSRQRIGVDYNETGATQITLAFAPIVGDNLIIDYVKTYVIADVIIYNETPGGAMNGVNTVFTTLDSFQTGKLLVYFNSSRQQLGVDYTETTPNSFTLSFAPVATDNIIVDYVRT